MIRPTLALAAAVTLCTVALGNQPTDLKPIISPARDQHAAPAALAAAIRDGRIVALGVVGLRTLDGDAAEIGDLAMIGSCGKAVTKLLLARLADSGKLSLDATLAEALPDVPMRDEYRAVKLADIVAHRAGLPPYTEIGPVRTPHLFKLTGTPREQRAAFVAHLLSEPPAAAPGARYLYSNAGYSLLGHVAERAVGMPFEELVAKEVFAPLGMIDARIGLPTDPPQRPHLAGHIRTPSGYAAARPRSTLHIFAPAGVMSCTISDFARLSDALWRVEAGEALDLLKPKSAARIRELRPADAGNPGQEGTVFYGGDGHYTAAFALWPSQKLGIVVATNAGDNDPVCAAILEAVRAEVAPQTRAIEQGQPAPKSPLGVLLNAPDPDHVMISEVKPGSLAEKSGLKSGDRIVAVNGVATTDLNADGLRAALAAQRIEMKVEREGALVEVVIERPAAKP